LFEVGPNPFGVECAIDDVTWLKRRVGQAWQDAAEIRRRLLVLKKTPQPRVSCGHKQQNGDDGTHRRLNHTGLGFKGSEPVP